MVSKSSSASLALSSVVTISAWVKSNNSSTGYIALVSKMDPDIAGPSGLERAKRINVAHDWLSDPELRGRYDRERGIRRSVRETGGRDPRSGGHRRPRPVRSRPMDPAEALARFLDRVAALDPDELDRLACADSTPIAFAATIARFLPPDQLAAIEAAETAVEARLDPAAGARPGVRDAVDGYATELVLGPFLDDLLSEPFRERTRERLTRGWEAAVGQPRYGPNGVAVRGLIGRLAHLDAGRRRRPGGDRGACRARRPVRGSVAAGTSPDDDEALRVSSVLASSTRRRRSRTTRPTTRPSSGPGAPRPGSRTCSSSGTPSGRRPSPSSPDRGVRASSPTTARLHGCGRPDRD